MKAFRDTPTKDYFTQFRPNWGRARKAMKDKQYETALEALSENESMFPSAETYEMMGECYFNLGRLEEAVRYLSASIGLEEGRLRSRFLLAGALDELGDAPKAIKHLTYTCIQRRHYKSARKKLDQLWQKCPDAAEQAEVRTRSAYERHLKGLKW